MFLWGTLLALLPICSVLAESIPSRNSQQCNSGSLKIYGRQCKRKCGYEFTSGSYKKAWKSCYSDCISSCADDARCTSASWNKSSKKCSYSDKSPYWQKTGRGDGVYCEKPKPKTTTTTKKCTTTTTQKRTTTTTPQASTTTTIQSTTTTQSATTTPSTTTTTTSTTVSTTTTSTTTSSSPTCTAYKLQNTGGQFFRNQFLQTTGDFDLVNFGGTDVAVAQEFTISPSGNLYRIVPGEAARIIYAFQVGSPSSARGDREFRSAPQTNNPDSDLPLTCTVVSPNGDAARLSCSRPGGGGPTAVFRACTANGGGGRVGLVGLAGDLGTLCAGRQDNGFVDLILVAARVVDCESAMFPPAI